MRDRGAAAVEMALILPLLLLVIAGLVDFGRAFYTQIVISNAAREGARMQAIGSYTNAQVDARVTQAIPASMGPTSITRTGCVFDAASNVKYTTVTVTVNPFQWLMIRDISSFFGGAINPPNQLQSTGSMRCEQ